MQFYDSTNETGVVNEIWDLTETDSNSYTLKSIARRANRWRYRIGTWMFLASPDWKPSDHNLTTIDVAKADLVNNQDWYTLPTEALAIKRIEILDSAGNAHQLKYLTESDLKGIAIDEFLETSSIPEYYMLHGNQVRLLPAADTTQVTATEGLQIHLGMRTIDELTAADTTQDMGIPENFEDIVALGCSYDFWVSHDRQKAQLVRGELEQKRQELESFVRSRNTEADVRIKPAHRTNDYV